MRRRSGSAGALGGNPQSDPALSPLTPEPNWSVVQAAWIVQLMLH